MLEYKGLRIFNIESEKIIGEITTVKVSGN